MNWKKNLLVILLLALVIPMTWSQSKENLGTGSKTDSLESSIGESGKSGKSGELWTDEEVQDFKEELVAACQEESDKAVDEAVKAAVISLIAENQTLAEKNGLLQEIIQDGKYDNLKTVIVTGVICFSVGYLVCKIVDSLVIPMVKYQGEL